MGQEISKLDSSLHNLPMGKMFNILALIAETAPYIGIVALWTILPHIVK